MKHLVKRIAVSAVLAMACFSGAAQAQATLSLPSGISLTGGVWTDINPNYDKIGNTTRTVNETDRSSRSGWLRRALPHLVTATG